eukprot:4338656-Prymnesium_polylepis.1
MYRCRAFDPVCNFQMPYSICLMRHVAPPVSSLSSPPSSKPSRLTRSTQKSGRCTITPACTVVTTLKPAAAQ